MNLLFQLAYLFLVLDLCLKCSGMNQDELEDFSNFLLKTSLSDRPKIGNTEGSEEESSGAEGEEEDAPSVDAWEHSGKFEGDIILSDRQRKQIVQEVSKELSRNALNDHTKRWPDNEVIYYIQKDHFSSGQLQAIDDGIDDIKRSSCIKFRPYKKGDADAVVIQGSRRGCFSQVGYQSGYQVLNLSGRHPVGRGCFRHGTVVHELLHSLGFYHMQSSPDRDEFIKVNWNNIIEGAKHNFRKYNSFSVTDFGIPYDYDSVLHYSARAFSNNGRPTLVPKKSGADIGQRIGMSNKDVQKLNKMYCEKDSGSNYEQEPGLLSKPIKKKVVVTKPFQGEGLGYYQGKSVVIKLPKVEVISVQSVKDPFKDFPSFDYKNLLHGFDQSSNYNYKESLPALDRPSKFNDEPNQSTKKDKDTKKPEPKAMEKKPSDYDSMSYVNSGESDPNKDTDDPFKDFPSIDLKKLIELNDPNAAIIKPNENKSTDDFKSFVDVDSSDILNFEGFLSKVFDKDAIKESGLVPQPKSKYLAEDIASNKETTFDFPHHEYNKKFASILKSPNRPDFTKRFNFGDISYENIYQPYKSGFPSDTFGSVESETAKFIDYTTKSENIPKDFGKHGKSSEYTDSSKELDTSGLPSLVTSWWHRF